MDSPELAKDLLIGFSKAIPAYYAGLFVVAHEFGHSCLGHFDAARHPLHMTDSDKKSPEHAPDEIRYDWDMELSADVFAANILVNAITKHVGEPAYPTTLFGALKLAELSIEILFAALRLYELSRNVYELGSSSQARQRLSIDVRSALAVLEVPPKSTHPPAAVRLLQVRKLFRHSPDVQDIVNGKGADSISLGRIVEPGFPLLLDLLDRRLGASDKRS